jgi:hypothetical protein
VTFDWRHGDSAIRRQVQRRDFLYAPAHAYRRDRRGRHNTGSQPERLAAGYCFTTPQSFDFNGTWAGFPVDGSDYLRFTILKNELSASVRLVDHLFLRSGGDPTASSRFLKTAMSGRIASGYRL